MEMQPFTITPAKKLAPPKMREDETDEEAEDRIKHEREMEKQGDLEFFIEGVESAIF